MNTINSLHFGRKAGPISPTPSVQEGSAILLRNLIKRINFENTPQRQQQYAALADKEICKQVLGVSKIPDTPRIRALKAYFNEYPMNPIGLVHNQAAFFNVAEGIQARLAKQIAFFLKQPRPMNMPRAMKITQLVLVSMAFSSWIKDIKKDPADFFKTCRGMENALLSQLQVGGGVRFAGRRDALNALYKFATCTTAYASTVVFLIGATYSLSVPATGGLLVYPKMLKQLAGHTELNFYKKAVLNRLLQIYHPEQSNDSNWRRQKRVAESLANMTKVPLDQLAKGADKYSGSITSSASILEKADASYHDGSLTKSITRGYYELLNGEATEEFFEDVSREQINGWLQCVHDTIRKFPGVEGFIEFAHQHNLEQYGLADAIPVVGILTSGLKAFAISGVGSAMKVELQKTHALSSDGYLYDHARKMGAKYGDVGKRLDVEWNTLREFVRGYYTNLNDYNPLTVVRRYIEKLF